MEPVDSGAADYEGGGLSRETNWWGAFVIGLAGTILVTGIAPVMVTSLGAAAIPMMVVITISGYLLCLILAELSAMMPERTGGSPTYAYVAYKDKWPRFAKHVNGFTAWAYWLGWFPVAPLNMILASFYIASTSSASSTSGVTPIHTSIAYWTIVISIVGILLVFIPAWLGIRLGAIFATVLGLLSMIPLTLLALCPIFMPSATNWGNLSGFNQLDGTGSSRPLGHNWLTIYIAFSFLLTWNVIAMEAAACYIGECRDPERDAKIAMNLEGLYGLFIYTMIPVSFVIVLGASQINSYVTEVGGLVDANRSSRRSPTTMFGSRRELARLGDRDDADHRALPLGAERDHGLRRGRCTRCRSTASSRGSSRGSTGTACPGFSMGFNVVCSIALVFTGGAVEIYTLSNVGYTASFIPVLVGYYLLRQYRPDMRRPVRLPEFFKYIALVLAAGVLRHLVYGGLVEASLPNAFLGGNDTQGLLLHRLGHPLSLPAALLVPHQGRGPEARARAGARAAADGRRRLITRVDRVGAVFRKASPPPDPATLAVERLVVASEGRPIAWAVLQQAFELARPARAQGARDLDRARLGHRHWGSPTRA